MDEKKHKELLLKLKTILRNNGKSSLIDRSEIEDLIFEEEQKDRPN